MLSFAVDRKFDIITIGRATIDLNSDALNIGIENTVSFSKYLGGSPANIAVASARLHQRTGFIGKVADDQFGSFIINYLRESNVDVSQIVIDKTGAKTGLSFTEIKSPTESSILMYRENVVDLKLAPEDIKEDYIKQTKVLLISGTALAESPSREAVFQAVIYAKKNGVKLFLDLDYRPYSWKSTIETSIYCSLVARDCDVIIGTREEFAMMDSEINLDNINDRNIAQKWLDKEGEIVVVKRGAGGSIAFTKAGAHFEQKALPANIIKTFGAGDSYAAAFIYGIMNDFSVGDAMELGAASAAIVISSHSCSEAMPSMKEIKTYLNKVNNEEFNKTC